MGDQFDKLAKDAGGELSRRESFGRIGWGLVVAFMASVGLARADSNNCAKKCAACCNQYIPPGSPEHGQCMRDCLTNTFNADNNCAGFVRLSPGCTE